MGRWDADAGGRLQRAAMALYAEHGYEGVTVAEIAASAGLTKRTFFRHFGDKPEVFFALASALEESVVAEVARTADHVAPIEAVVGALTGAGEELLAQVGQFARWRRDLVASSAELQERELSKRASLTAALVGVLQQRGVAALPATLAAQAGITVFTTAYDRWIDVDGAVDFRTLVQQTLDELRRTISAR